jgi:hypothetical protein
VRFELVTGASTPYLSRGGGSACEKVFDQAATDARISA